MARSIIDLFQHNALIPMPILLFSGGIKTKNWLETDENKLSTLEKTEAAVHRYSSK